MLSASDPLQLFAGQPGRDGLGNLLAGEPGAGLQLLPRGMEAVRALLQTLRIWDDVFRWVEGQNMSPALIIFI